MKGVFLLSEVISTYIEHKKERGKERLEKKTLGVCAFAEIYGEKEGLLAWCGDKSNDLFPQTV